METATDIVALVDDAIHIHLALQKPQELASLATRVRALEPKVIVEIGCDAGGTLWLWRNLCPEADTIGIDLPNGMFASGHPLDAGGAEVIIGDSHTEPTMSRLLWQLNHKPIDFLFIDGDHTFEGVMLDFIQYGPLVRKGGLIAFHDVLEHPSNGAVGVHRLWKMLVSERGGALALIAEPRTWGGIGLLPV